MDETKTPVRVIRVIEYTYDSLEFCNEDRLRWTTQLATPHMVMRSVALDPGLLGEFETPYAELLALRERADEILKLEGHLRDAGLGHLIGE